MSWKNSHCLVTGGAGFIGSHIAETLAQKGAQVTVLDDLSTGHEANLEPLRELGVEFVRGSILDEELLAKTFAGMEYVFHQAALPSVPQSIAEPLRTAEVNATGTLLVLEAALQAGVKKGGFASSCAVYGDNSALPLSEAELPSPLSPYAAQKLASEHYCKIYSSVYDLPTTTLRYFNVYGPRQDPTSQYAAVVPNFIAAVARGKSPIIYGDGEQSRDLIFVADAVQANLKAARSSRANGAVVNVAVGERTTINELAAMVIKLVGAGVEPEHLKPRTGDIRHSLADISLACELIDYEPQYNLEQGLRETVQFFIGD